MSNCAIFSFFTFSYVSGDGHLANVSICQIKTREQQVYTSNGRDVKIAINSASIDEEQSEFILKFKGMLI